MDQERTAQSEITGMNVSVEHERLNFHDTLHLFTVRIEDYRFTCSAADSSQNCCLACVGSPDHEDTELSEPFSSFLNLLSSEQRFR
jgi:hypothetical protein